MHPADETAERRTPAGPIAVFAALAALALLAVQVHWLWPYISDDAFISLRYAERFADGHGLTWNDGDRVEGYSNLLWVLATAGLLKLGLDGVLALRLLGAVCAAAAIAVVAAALAPRKWAQLPGAFAAPLLLAACPALAAWTCGGLETPMVLLWSSCGLALLLPAVRRDGPRRRCLLAGLPLALLCMTRPDGPLWVGATAVVAALAWFLEHGFGKALSRLTALVFLPFLAVAGQLAFRITYYGDWLPNTAHVKTDVSRLSLEAGLRYVAGAATAHAALLVLALLALLLVLRGPERKRAAVLAAPVLVFAGYLVAIGGEHFVGWRMLAMVLAPLVLLAALGLRVLAQKGVAGAGLAWLLALAAPALQLWLTRTDERTQKARAEHWEWQGKAQGELLRTAFAGRAEPPLLAVDGAGVLPYYSRLPSLDMLGLNDATIARTPPAQAMRLERFVAGHMHGNGSYVLGRQPDLVQFQHPPGEPRPMFTSGLWLEQDASFRRDYRCVRLEVPTPMPPDWAPQPVAGVLWVRLCGRAGVQLQPGRVEVPAWLLGSLRQLASLPPDLPQPLDDGAPQFRALQAADRWLRARSVAVPGEGGIVLELRDRQPVQLQELPLAKGNWRAACTPAAAGASLAITLRDAAGNPLPRDGDAWCHDAQGPVLLEVQVVDGAPLPQRLASVVLTAR